MNTEGEANQRMHAVWAAARDADAQYAAHVTDAHGLTRAEYVGRAVMVALDANTGNEAKA